MEFTIDIGGILMNIVGFLIVYVLHGIKGELTDVKNTVSKLSDSLVKLDKRVLVLETLKETTNGHHYT